jgi:hypothetical protein
LTPGLALRNSDFAADGERCGASGPALVDVVAGVDLV